MVLGKDSGVYLIDAHYAREQLASVYLIEEKGKVALVETAHAKSLDFVLAKLAELGLGVEAVEYIFVTHIHLDHAGGAGSYMQAFPHAKLVVHPKGVRHMIDPSKLEAGVIAVYGAEFVQNMYGKLEPISADRVVSGENGLVVNLNGRELVCYDTPGHANHHNVIWDTKTQFVFTGDVFGIGYPELNVNGRVFAFPSTSPVNFDPIKMEQSINFIVSLNPKAALLTHFGAVLDVPRMATDLKRMMNKYVAIAQTNLTIDNRVVAIKSKLVNVIKQEAYDFGVRLSDDEFNGITDIDMQLNAQGLDVWLTINSNSK